MNSTVRSSVATFVVALATSTALSAQLPPEDPAAAAVAALLRGETGTARILLAGVHDPARRARLQAALLPASRRAAAMLAVARAFERDAAAGEECDHAIHAAAAAVLIALGRDEVFDGAQEIEAFPDVERDRVDAGALNVVIEGLLAVLDARRERGGDRALLDDAEHWLALACTTRHEFAPLRVASDAAWRVPRPLRETILLRATRVAPGPLDWRTLRWQGEATRTVVLLGDGEDTDLGPSALAAFEPGAWQIELRSASRPWRGVRCIEVSDLEVLGVAEHDTLAIGTWRNGRDATAMLRVERAEGPPITGEVDGAAVVQLPRDGGLEHAILLRDEAHVAWLPAPRSFAQSTDDATPYVAHVMVDRPLHRRGETILGRVVLRHCEHDGSGLDRRVSTSPAPHRRLVLRAFAETPQERRLELRTDEAGVAGFAVGIADDVPFDDARLRLEVEEGEAVTCVFDAAPSLVAEFRRPALFVDVDGPREVQRGQPVVTVTATARHASGGPAADLPVHATARSGRMLGWDPQRRVESRTLRTDAQGRASLPIATAELAAGELAVEFVIEAPDGRRETVAHALRLVDPSMPAAEVPIASPSELRLEVDESVVVDGICHVAVVTGPHEELLVVAGRGRDARCERIESDGDGRAHARFDVLAADWPRLEIAAATRSARFVAQATVPVSRRERPTPAIELQDLVRPGEEIEVRVSSIGEGAVVTLSIVDERVFSLAADRNREPEASLAPPTLQPRWRRFATAEPTDPGLALAELLVDGRVPQHAREPGRPVAGAGGPAMGGMSGGATLRDEFRATAAFRVAVAGSDGVARFRVAMPDDLTTWRASFVGVERDGVTFTARRALTTRLPIAAEPLLPRGLRDGDSIALPIVVDRARDALADRDRAQVLLAANSPLLAVASQELAADLLPGTTAQCLVDLVARGEGEVELDLAVALGAHVDRSRRSLRLWPDAILRSRTSVVQGRLENGTALDVPWPDGADPREGIEIECFGSTAAIAETLADALAEYPYGCVEQTLSRLLPFFAAARGARVHGREAPNRDEAFRARLVEGLSRMRALQTAPGAAFAWWPGEPADLAMTALVLHGLVVMREGGLDPRSVGLDLDPSRGDALQAIARVSSDPHHASTGDAEFAAAVLRLLPEHAHARAAAVALADAERSLPHGLLARLGLALHAADDHARARRCLERMREEPAAREHAASFAGEGDLAVAALRLELAMRLEPKEPSLSAAGDALALQVLDGRGSTYGVSCALATLALLHAPQGTAVQRLRVRCGEVERTLVLEPGNGRRASTRFPIGNTCHVTGEGQLVVRARGRVRERASTHAGWSTPIVVERALLRRTRDPRTTQVSEVPITDGQVVEGETLVMRIAVRSPLAVGPTVVVCPLPAGFELVSDAPGIERHADRIVTARPGLHAHVPFEWRVLVVPTLRGRVLWPPATAESMYVADVHGGSRGDWLAVGPRVPRESTAIEPCFQAAPVVRRSASIVIEDTVVPGAAENLRARVDCVIELWQEHLVDGEAGPCLGLVEAPSPSRRLELEGDWRAIHADLSEAPRAAFAALTDLLGELEPAPRGRVRYGAALSRWQSALVERARSLHTLALRAALAGVEAHTDAEPIEEIGMLALTALHLRAGDLPFEAELARCLGIASRASADWLDGWHDELRLLARGAELREALRLLAPPDRLGGLAEDELPPALLIPREDGPEIRDWVRRLSVTEPGRLELLTRLREPDFVEGHSSELVDGLPESLWSELELRTHALFVDQVEDRVLCERIAGGRRTDDELVAALRAGGTGAWRRILAEALRVRRVQPTVSTAHDDDPALSSWERALGQAVRGDADGAATLLLELAAQRGRLPVQIDDLERFAVDVVARAPAALSPERCRALFATLETSDAERLLERAAAPFAELPAAPGEALWPALWDYACRCRDSDRVTALLRASAAGEEFLADREPESSDEEPVSERTLLLRGLATRRAR